MLNLKEAAGVSKIGQMNTAQLLRHRVYAFGKGAGHAPGVLVKQDAMDLERAEMAVLQAQIATLGQIIKLLGNELSDVKKDRDAWRSQAGRLRRSTSADLTWNPRPGSFAASLQHGRIHFRQH
jgi:hypothetical protein